MLQINTDCVNEAGLSQKSVLSSLRGLCRTLLSYLDNCTDSHDCMPFQQEGAGEMATKINRTVVVNGVQRWIHANTEQEYADKLAKLSMSNRQP